MNDTTQTPPERCPVCGAGSQSSYIGTDLRWYTCGAYWNCEGPGWKKACRYAMTAALRCGATLEPTPLETARTELVEAAVKWDEAVYEVANSDSAGLENAHFERLRAADILLQRSHAYRALLEPAP